MYFCESFRRSGGIMFPCSSILAQMASLSAFAAAAEGQGSENARAEYGKMDPSFGYGRNPDPAFLPGPTRYGSYVESAIAVARALVESDAFTASAFARVRIDEYKRSSATTKTCRQQERDWKKVRLGDEEKVLLKAPFGFEGAVVGATLLGVLPTVERVIEATTGFAAVWDLSPTNVFVARTVALATHWSLYRDEPDERLRSFLYGSVGILLGERGLTAGTGEEVEDFEVALRRVWSWHRPVTFDRSALEVMQAALALAEAPQGAEADMKLCLRPGGRVGPVMAVAAAIKAPRRPFEALPLFLSRDLERSDPTTGTARLLELGGALMERYG